MRREHSSRPTRRTVLGSLFALSAAYVSSRALAQHSHWPPIDTTFLFIADIHACRMASGLAPNCQREGKTDENLLRHIAALNRITEHVRQAEIEGAPTWLAGAGVQAG